MDKTERDVKIIAAARSGCRRIDIAAQFGLSVGTIYNVLAQARRDGIVMPRSPDGHARRCGSRRVSVANSTTQKFDHAAAARNITSGQLCGRLLDVIAQDDLIDAILDDKGDAGD